MTKNNEHLTFFCTFLANRINYYNYKMKAFHISNLSTQHIATLWVAACCVHLATWSEVLQHVGCCCPKFENGQIFHATSMDVAGCCSRLARFVTQCCAQACVLVWFQYPTCRNKSQQGGQTCATCCNEQRCNMMHSNVVIVWSELANVGPAMLGYVVLKCCDHLAGA